MKYEDLPNISQEYMPQGTSKIERAIHPCEYKQLFESLNLLNNTSWIPDAINNPSPHSSTEGIPKVLHYIWLGSRLPVKYYEDISFFADRIREIGGITLLWTDQEDVDIELREWLERNSVYLIPIASVFSDAKTMSTYYHFRASLNAIPSIMEKLAISCDMRSYITLEGIT